MYDERFVSPMRQELTQLGVEEMRTAQEVDAKLKDAPGTTLVVVNSVCGCAARNARPAVAKAIQHEHKPLELTAERAAQGWGARVHARAPSDRGSNRGRYCEGSDEGVRQVLRRNHRRL